MNRNEIVVMFAELSKDRYIDENVVIDVIDYIEQSGAELDGDSILDIYYEFMEDEEPMYDCDYPYLEYDYDPYAGCYSYDY